MEKVNNQYQFMNNGLNEFMNHTNEVAAINNKMNFAFADMTISRLKELYPNMEYTVHKSEDFIMRNAMEPQNADAAPPEGLAEFDWNENIRLVIQISPLALVPGISMTFVEMAKVDDAYYTGSLEPARVPVRALAALNLYATGGSEIRFSSLWPIGSAFVNDVINLHQQMTALLVYAKELGVFVNIPDVK